MNSHTWLPVVGSKTAYWTVVHLRSFPTANAIHSAWILYQGLRAGSLVTVPIDKIFKLRCRSVIIIVVGYLFALNNLHIAADVQEETKNIWSHFGKSSTTIKIFFLKNSHINWTWILDQGFAAASPGGCELSSFSAFSVNYSCQLWWNTK